MLNHNIEHVQTFRIILHKLRTYLFSNVFKNDLWKIISLKTDSYLDDTKKMVFLPCNKYF